MAVAVPLGVAQLVLSDFAQVTVGGVVVLPTTAWQLLVHPVVVFVTVTVYVPADSPVILAVFAPVLHAI